MNRDDLRRAVSRLAGVGRAAVGSVRTAFASGEVPFQTAGSGSVANYLDRFIDEPEAKALVKGTARLGLSSSPGVAVLPPPRPELDEAMLVEDRNRGVLDQFTVHLTVSVRAQDIPRIGSLKVFKAELDRAKVHRPSAAVLSALPSVGGKGTNHLLATAQRVDDLGVGPTVTTFVTNDVNGPGLIATAPSSRMMNPPLDPRNTNRTGSPAALVDVKGADRSVLEDVTFYLNRRAVGALEDPPRPPLVLPRGVDRLGDDRVTTSTQIVQESNAMKFTVVGTLSPEGPSAVKVGGTVELSFVDPTVVYGGRYAYYVAATGHEGQLGPRSRIINVTVSRTVPPDQPQVSYSLVSGVPRFSIRCTPGTSHVEIYRSGRPVDRSQVLGSDESLVVERRIQVGGFYHLEDVSLGPDGSATYVDRSSSPGDRLVYRFYSVDAYGLKSQTPFTCELRVPAPGERVPLAIPSITTEQVQLGDAAVRVFANVDDERVTAFIFTRREISIGERAVHQVNQPEYVLWGTPDPKRAGSRVGPYPKDLEWQSVVRPTSGSASFIDTSVRVDRTYQYGVYGVDLRGNMTPVAGAPPLGVYSKPTVDAPTAFKVVLLEESGEPKGVLLTWSPGTSDFSPNDLLEDQDVLAAYSVRSAFQVERRLKGSPFWDALPATTESYFIDQVSDDPAPAFRPPYVVRGLEYEYRVLSMQSGGFLSPRTDPISVTVAPPPMSPGTVWVRSTDITVRPRNVVVSWDMPTRYVLHWEVQRAVVNRVYGSRITSMDSPEARSLPYETVALVAPESSRAAGLEADDRSVLDRSVYVGSRFYVDPDVDPSNSYFYRVRSVGLLGRASDWTYGGIQLVDHAFDRKLSSRITPDMKVRLSEDPSPIVRSHDQLRLRSRR